MQWCSWCKIMLRKFFKISDFNFKNKECSQMPHIFKTDRLKEFSLKDASQARHELIEKLYFSSRLIRKMHQKKKYFLSDLGQEIFLQIVYSPDLSPSDYNSLLSMQICLTSISNYFKILKNSWKNWSNQTGIIFLMIDQTDLSET